MPYELLADGNGQYKVINSTTREIVAGSQSLELAHASLLSAQLTEESTTRATLATTEAADKATAALGNLAPTIADPGNAGAIPVTLNGRVALVTAGAETRTLAAPTFAGQELLIYAKTLVGNAVVTCATTVNETGNNTITFSATGQALLLVAVEEGANLRWRVARVDGAALSTV